MNLIIKKVSLRESLRGLLVILILYCYIFNPPFAFLPIGLSKFMYILAFPLFLLPAVRRMYWNNFSSITMQLLLYILYTFVIHVVFSSKASYAQINLFILFESFFTAYVIAYFLVRYYKNKADGYILWTTILACFITTLLIINPHLNTFVRDTLLVEARDGLQDVFAFRAFGIADDLLFTYAIALSVGLCICMQYARRNSVYYFFIVFFLVAIFFNARVGMVPFMLYVVYVAFVERRFSLFVKLALIIVLPVVFVLQSNILEDYKTTVEWITDGFFEIFNLLSGKQGDKASTFDNLSMMLIIPETIGGFLFGTGEDIFLARKNSDIGYILQLNYGGIIYVFFFVFIVLGLYTKLKKYNTNKWFNFVFIGTFLICNIKGYFFYTCSGMRMLMLLFFVYILSKKMQSISPR